MIKSKKYSGKLRNMASIYLRAGDQILLLYRQGKSIVSNLWIGSAGGHFEENELNDAESCVLRELAEELSIMEDSIENISLRYVTLRYCDDEIRQNYYFFADYVGTTRDTLPSTEGITQWHNINALQDLPMPFTARYIVDHYVSVGQFDDCLYGGLANNSGVLFHTL